MMNVVIRADASIAIGTGHIMRCLTLADGLREAGVEVSFICRTDRWNLISLIAERGYTVHSLSSGLDVSEDCDMTRSIIERVGRIVDWFIVDHYGLGEEYESALRTVARQIMVIDDLADRRHDCDLLLNQNYGVPGTRYDDLVPLSCMKAIGTSYALIRPDIVKARQVSGVRTGLVRRILVFLGGSDSTNETAKVLRAFEKCKRKDVFIDVVIGPANENKAMVEKLALRMPTSRCHVNVPSLAALMSAADLAVGAGGSSMWERCCIGLPTLAVTVAGNQVALTEALAIDGFIIYAGPNTLVSETMLCRDLEFLMAHPDVVHLLSERCRSLVDGKGIDRVIRLITASELSVVLRQAEERDCRIVFDWRNHPDIVNASFDSQPLRWDSHQQWFAETLHADDRKLLIAEIDGKSVGVLRYDLRGDDAVVSIYLAPERIGCGIGPYVLQAGTEWVCANLSTVKRITARVKPGNEVSARAFRKARFQEHHRLFHREL